MSQVSLQFVAFYIGHALHCYHIMRQLSDKVGQCYILLSSEKCTLNPTKINVNTATHIHFLFGSPSKSVRASCHRHHHHHHH